MGFPGFPTIRHGLPRSGALAGPFRPADHLQERFDTYLVLFGVGFGVIGLDLHERRGGSFIMKSATVP
jgi:hypothetical protein